MLSPLLVAKSKSSDLCMLPAMANRHGLITGATGTGKTVTLVERAFIVPPGSRVGPLTDEERRKAIDGSLVAGHYEKAVDRDSAHEQLKARAMGSQIGRSTIRGVLGSIPGGGAKG